MTGEPIANPLFPYNNLDPAALIKVFSSNPAVADAVSRTQAVDQALRDKLAGTDPDYVKTPDDFSGYSHQAIYDGVHGAGGMNITTITTLRDTWKSIETELTRIATTHQNSANGLLGFGEWAGASGDAVRAGISALNTSILQMAQVCEAMKNRLDIVGPAAEAVRAAVPPPTAQLTVLNPDDTHTSLIPGLINPATATIDRQAQRQAELDAQATMNRIYTPTIPPTGSGVPSYSVVPAGTNSGGDPSSSGGGAPSSGSPTSGSPTAGSPTAETPTEPQSPTTEEPTTPASTTPTDDESASSDSPSSTTSPTDAESTSPASTTPASTGLTPTASGSPLGSTGTPGSALGNAGSPGGLTSPSPGQATPGLLQSPSAGSTVAAGGSAAGSRAGTGMGMMPGAGAGAGRKTEGDDEHRSPDYLRGVQPELLVTTPALTGAIGEYPDGDLGEPADSTGSRESPRTAPATVSSILDTPTESPTPTAVSAAHDLPDRPAVSETSVTTTASTPNRSAIEPTAPSLPPEIAALLAEHGTQDPAPTPAAESERANR